MPEWVRRLKAKGKSNIPHQQASTGDASTSRVPASTVQPSLPLPQHTLSVQTSALALAPRNPFEDKGKLLRDALDDPDTEDPTFVEEQLGPNSDVEKDAARVETLRGQNQAERSNQWIASMKKIACQIMQFAPVVDVATNVKPEVLSLPWAGIRSLLMVAQKTQEQSESILDGIKTVLDTSHLLNVYFDIYGQLDATPAIGHLYLNVVKLYGLNLTFVAHAQHTYDMNKFERMIQSLTGQVIPKFKTDHDRMLRTVEYHARAVDREVSEEQRTWVNEKLKRLEKTQAEINQGVKGVQQTLNLNALQVAAGAAYDSMDYSGDNQDGDFQLCLHGTRVDITEAIQKWATTNDEQRVFWLSGKAGTGKSTIARTVAHELAKQGYLVGSFFFKRGGDSKLRKAQYLFPTIAHQMAYFTPSISDKIADASRDSPPDENSKALEKKFEMLIQGPLSGYSTGSATDVRAIVIDAIDECDARRAVGQAMKLWPKLSSHTSMNLRVFVTSRSDNEIWGTLGQLEPKYLRYERLEDWQSSTIENDLRRYCGNELKKIREERKNNLVPDELGDEWPGEDVVDRLVQISQPLFIATSTILRDARNDPGHLQERVNGLKSTGTDALTAIYLDILNQAAKLDIKWPNWFGQVIKPLAVLHSSLTISALTDLLGGNTMVVANALNPLSSVIEFPSGKEVKAGSRAAVRVYHESFRDFLMDPSLKDHPEFWIDQGEVHGVLMSKCLNLLEKKLVHDVCKQKHPGTEREDVPAECIDRHIPESVQYACRYWTSHAIHSNEAIEDGGQVDLFLRAFLLYWTEAMAWLGKLGEMVVCLKQLRKAIDSQSSPRLHSFVADTLRWVPAIRNLISDTPLQTYSSALAFAPSNSVVRKSFRSDMEDFLQVWLPVATDWGFELQTLRGHSHFILSITPSIDGRRLVTVGRDNTVRLWDVESGTEEKRTEIGRSYRLGSDVASAFPEEDLVVIAGSSGEHWRWNLEDDARRIDLELPSEANSVSVSPNGRYAAWGLDTGEIYIWDAENDAGQVVESHSSSVECMAFSSDSETLVSGSTDIWKWSPQAGPGKLCQVGTIIKCIAISPNGKFVVFRSASIYHGTISVFHCTSHEVDQIMQISQVDSLMVTPDSQKVLTGYWDSLYLYDFQTQQEPMKLPLETSGITAMTSSRDGKTIWAGDYFGLIRQLDVDLLLKSPQHRTGPATIALSTDGRSLALWSHGNQLSLWNIETRICEPRLTDHRLWKSRYRRILISSDSRFVVVACTDNPPANVVLIWDLEANALRELKDRPSHVTTVELSPDNKTLLCGFYDGQIWAADLERGVLREKFTGHTLSINDIAISLDGQNFASASYDKTIRIWGPKSQTPSVLSSEVTMYGACFSADGRMLYTYDFKNSICEWNIEKTCIVRTLAEGPEYGSILIDGRFVPSRFLPVIDRLVAKEVDQPQTQVDSSASTSSTSMFQDRQICALDRTKKWITVGGRKMFKCPDQRGYDWFSCGRTMVFPNRETDFTVLYFTGKDSF
ncbi:hypothetical protein K470DRAFT_260515 [Piedraia hortae CBS 480.64]|uniref:Mitochondrial division protein 1 n=1 Tax=Piedraia hortae CBS 480.64 TaxID=1314780 RepID=A0A6A7BSN9_9PEZI|nr:hypothetical protein K470DRAFT_260515 [Piedraia hortae CBS 480.64]